MEREAEIYLRNWLIPWRRAWQPTPVSLPGESHGQRRLVGYSPWGRKESDRTEHACRQESSNLLSSTSVGLITKEQNSCTISWKHRNKLYVLSYILFPLYNLVNISRYTWLCQFLQFMSLLLFRKLWIQDFPGGRVAKTPCAQCRGPNFDPWSENQIPHAATKEPACHKEGQNFSCWRSLGRSKVSLATTDSAQPNK